MKRFGNFFLAFPLVINITLTAIPSQTATAPTFQQYRVSRRYTGKPAAVSLNTPEARRFRTVLRNGAKQGPNFAGNYTVVTWGCGTSCQSMAIVDARNGKVYLTGVTVVSQ